MTKQKSILLDGFQAALGRFEKLPDGWVKDNFLGIDWGPSSEKRMNWEDAGKFCAEKDKEGRMPEAHEQISLIDFGKIFPVINPEFFPDTKTCDWYWTRTPVAAYPGIAWTVNFYRGDVGNSNKVFDNYVRPVRPSK
ncbi:MAG: DUF1566 domain-containing protein [bacterium]|nr:DUF1566 domain-containing protein [bacterium]